MRYWAPWHPKHSDRPWTAIGEPFYSETLLTLSSQCLEHCWAPRSRHPHRYWFHDYKLHSFTEYAHIPQFTHCKWTICWFSVNLWLCNHCHNPVLEHCDYLFYFPGTFIISLQGKSRSPLASAHLSALALPLHPLLIPRACQYIYFVNHLRILDWSLPHWPKSLGQLSSMPFLFFNSLWCMIDRKDQLFSFLVNSYPFQGYFILFTITFSFLCGQRTMSAFSVSKECCGHSYQLLHCALRGFRRETNRMLTPDT